MELPKERGQTRGAVFLSYAREDSAVVHDLAEALGAAGIETWFDQDELRGGDSWDLTIRRQIRECELFVPIISEAALKRLEGYFRRERRLAIERSRDMAEEKAFLVPAAIDSVSEIAPGIPEGFTHVQWSRIRSAPELAKFVQRIADLLSGTADRGREPPKKRAPQASQTRRPTRGIVVGICILVSLAAGIAVILRPSSPMVPKAGVPQPATATPASGAWLPSDPELLKAWGLIYGVRFGPSGKIDEYDTGLADFELAEEVIRPILTLHPNDPDTLIVAAHLNLWYICRSFDRSAERQALAQRYCQRALQTAPENPEANIAMAQFLGSKGIDLPRARQLAEKAIQINPREPRYYRTLFVWVMRDFRELINCAIDSSRRFPHDYLTLYDVATILTEAGRISEADTCIDQAIALAPNRGAALLEKAYILYRLHGDPRAMQETLSRISGPVTLSARYAFTSFLCAQLRDAPGDALGLVQALPEPEMHDWFYTGPVALLEADLLKAQGKNKLSEFKYLQALESLEAHLKSEPTKSIWLDLKSWVLLMLGRKEEAKAAAAIFLSSLDRPYGRIPWWYSAVPLFACLGDDKEALILFREQLSQPGLSQGVGSQALIDPRLKRWVALPEVKEAIAKASVTP